MNPRVTGTLMPAKLMLLVAPYTAIDMGYMTGSMPTTFVSAVGRSASPYALLPSDCFTANGSYRSPGCRVWLSRPLISAAVSNRNWAACAAASATPFLPAPTCAGPRSWSSCSLQLCWQSCRVVFGNLHEYVRADDRPWFA